MDIMLDLETLGTAQGSAIVQIGAVAFDPHSFTLGTDFRCNVNALDVLLRGFGMDQSTMEWWADRDYNHLLNQSLPLASALLAFRVYFEKQAGTEFCIWSHGAAFDVPMLDYAFTQMGLDKPWHYRNVRDTRTLFALAENFGWVKPEGKAVAHDARADACEQARMVQSAYKKIHYAGN
jgi:3'-5' exoribonuclease-like protein